MVHTWSRYVKKIEATNPLYSTVWQHRNLHGRIFTVHQRTDIYCERGQVAIHPDEQWVAIADGGNHVVRRMEMHSLAVSTVAGTIQRIAY